MSATALDPRLSVVESIDNETCPFCEAGSLESGRYKGDPAVVCDDCEAPLVRLFGE